MHASIQCSPPPPLQADCVAFEVQVKVPRLMYGDMAGSSCLLTPQHAWLLSSRLPAKQVLCMLPSMLLLFMLLPPPLMLPSSCLHQPLCCLYAALSTPHAAFAILFAAFTTYTECCPYTQKYCWGVAHDISLGTWHKHVKVSPNPICACSYSALCLLTSLASKLPEGTQIATVHIDLAKPSSASVVGA